MILYVSTFWNIFGYCISHRNYCVLEAFSSVADIYICSYDFKPRDAINQVLKLLKYSNLQ